MLYATINREELDLSGLLLEAAVKCGVSGRDGIVVIHRDVVRRMSVYMTHNLCKSGNAIYAKHQYFLDWWLMYTDKKELLFV